MYWWKELLFVSSYKVCFLFQNFVSCSVSYNINWIVTQIGFFPGPHICSKALTGVGRGITSPFHGDFYFNFHLSWLMCKSWMLQRLEKLICLVRSFSMSCDIFDLHICQDRWKLENWCLLLTQVDCRNISWRCPSTRCDASGNGRYVDLALGVSAHQQENILLTSERIHICRMGESCTCWLIRTLERKDGVNSLHFKLHIHNCCRADFS